MSNPIIERALEETVCRYGQTIAPGFHPNRYGVGQVVKEADLVFHFVNALERQCALPVSYREFSCDGEKRPDGKKVQFIDAVVVDVDSIYLIEAKGSLVIENGRLDNAGQKKLDALENQLGVFKDSGYSLRYYLVHNIVRRFGSPEWGDRAIRYLWGIALADAFRVKESTWMALDKERYPVLARYTRSVHECSQYRTEDGQAWFILSGYKELSDHPSGISYTGDRIQRRQNC